MTLWDHRRMPRVGAAMTPFPYSVEESADLNEVEELMQEHSIRHVPVHAGDEVVGIVTERDLLRLQGAGRTTGTAGEVAIRPPYLVDMSVALDEVVDALAENRIGAAVVTRHGKLAGILSLVDVCRVAVDLLRGRFPKTTGDDAA